MQALALLPSLSPLYLPLLPRTQTTKLHFAFYIQHSAFLWLFLAYAHNGSGASCLHVLCIFTLIENVVAN